VLHLRKGAHTAGGILPRETLHVDGDIEPLALQRALEGGAVLPIPLNPGCPLGDLPTAPACEAGDLVTLLEQSRHETGAEMTGSTDDADPHACNTPLWKPNQAAWIMG
jgi:hypothetical protein